jgi:hypothetical protein
MFGEDGAAPLDRGHEAVAGPPFLDGGHQDADRLVPDIGRYPVVIPASATTSTYRSAAEAKMSTPVRCSVLSIPWTWNWRIASAWARSCLARRGTILKRIAGCDRMNVPRRNAMMIYEATSLWTLPPRESGVCVPTARRDNAKATATPGLRPVSAEGEIPALWSATSLQGFEGDGAFGGLGFALDLGHSVSAQVPAIAVATWKR